MIGLMTPLLIVAQNAAEEASYHMTIGGWITMIASVGFVTFLLAWCVYKVLSTPGAEKRLHSQIDIETPDVNDP